MVKVFSFKTSFLAVKNSLNFFISLICMKLFLILLIHPTTFSYISSSCSIQLPGELLNSIFFCFGAHNPPASDETVTFLDLLYSDGLGIFFLLYYIAYLIPFPILNFFLPDSSPFCWFIPSFSCHTNFNSFT